MKHFLYSCFLIFFFWNNNSLAQRQDIAGWTFDTESAFADIGNFKNATIKEISIYGVTFSSSKYVNGYSGKAINSKNWNDGSVDRYWQISFDATGFENLQLSSKMRSSNTGPKDFQIQYSLDSSNWTNITEVIVANNWTSGRITELALPAEVADQPLVYIRWLATDTVAVNDGAISSGGANKLDDILITGELLPDATPNTAAPVFSMLPGEYINTQILKLTSETEGVKIYYTLDGTEPDTFSTEFVDSLLISESMEVKAKAFKPGYHPSATVSAYYTIYKVNVPVDFQFNETFDSLVLSGSSYTDGQFEGANGIDWHYTHATGEQSFPIIDKGLLLRRSGNGSKVVSDTISGGISSFYVQMRKAFTGSGDRQIALFINGNEIAQSQTFGNFSGASREVFEFAVNDINVEGDFTIEIRHLSGGSVNRQLVIDNIAWNSYAIDDADSTDSSIEPDPLLITSLSPANNSTNIAKDTVLSIIFNKPVTKGSGNISLYNANDDVIESILVTDSKVAIEDDSVSIIISELADSTNYFVLVDQGAFLDSIGNAFEGINRDTVWAFMTDYPEPPAVTVSFENIIPFGKTKYDNTSETQSFSISAQSLASEVVIEASDYFEVRTGQGEFEQALQIPTSAFDSGNVVVDVRFAPLSGKNGIISGNIQVTTVGSTAYNIELEGEETGNAIKIPYRQNFDSSNLFSESGWANFNVRGNQNWEITDIGDGNNNTGRAAEMNGYFRGAADNENWLISPLLNIDTTLHPVLHYYSRSYFSGPRLRLAVSSNYDGSSDPTAEEFTWTTLEDKFTPETGAWYRAENIDLTDFKGKPVYVAFIYNSSPETGAAEWRIDDFEITIEKSRPKNLDLNVGPLINQHLGVVNPGEFSIVKGYNFTATGLTEPVSLSIEPPFELSKDGEGFGSSLSFVVDESFRSKIYVRYSPEVAGVDVSAITLTEGDSSRELGRFTASSKPQDETFDVVTWNIEWFGSTEPFQGPYNVNRQWANVKTMIEWLDADVYAFQEITDLAMFYKLVDSLPGYSGFHSSAVSSGSTFEEAQKLAFLYKKTSVDSVTTKVLLEGVRVNSLSDYPGSDPGRFWASGRFPFLFEVRTKVGGVEKNINLISVHARSNGGGEAANNQRYLMRKYDAGVLKDSLDEYYSRVPIIILGDYNDDLDETIADQNAPTVSTSETSYIRFVEDTENYTPVTLGLSKARLTSYIGSEDVIDHMIISNELANSWLSGSERVVIPFDLIPFYSNSTSDHMPVMTRFSLVCDIVAGNISGPSETCEGSDVVLTVPETNYGLHWQKENETGEWEISQLETGNTFNLIPEIGETKIRVKYTEGSCEAYSGEFLINTAPTPSPVIERIGNDLATIEGDYSYRWFRDSLEIAGENSSTLPAPGEGRYIVEVTSNTGGRCTGISEHYEYAIHEREISSEPIASLQIRSEAIKVSPNPATTKVTITMPSYWGLKRVAILNMAGVKVYDAFTEESVVTLHFDQDTNKFTKGVYLINVTGNNGLSQTRRLVVVGD